MEKQSRRLAVGILLFCGFFVMGNGVGRATLQAAESGGPEVPAMTAAKEKAVLPGYEDTIWGVTGEDGQAVSGLTPEMTEEAARQRRPERGIRVRINGDDVDFPDQGPVLERGRVLVPMRPVFESMYVQCRVEWDAEEAAATVLDQRGRRVIFRPGENSYLIVESGGGQRELPLDVPAAVRNGRVLLPLRALLETFDYKVAWLPAEQMADIQDTYPGWRQLMKPDAWQKALEEDCVPCALVKEAQE